MAVLLMMAQSNANANKPTDEVKPTIFHDFLGRNYSASDQSLPEMASGDARLPSAPPSVGGGRGPISTASDLCSERQVGYHFEGVPFYGARDNLSGPEVSNKLAGSKRINSDSALVELSKDGFPQRGESSRLMKMLRSGGGERPRQSHDEEMLTAMRPMRPTSTSFRLQPPSGFRSDANASKWERAVPMNISPPMQYPSPAGQVAPFGYQLSSNKSKDANSGPSVISQVTGDEGSRTGINGSGLSISTNTGHGVSENILSEMLPSGSKQKSMVHGSDPESSISLSRHGLTSAGHQMTIFYAGQAHVFDDVHPNKADVIMALAASNGGSWSPTYLPKSKAENHKASGENDAGTAVNLALPPEIRPRLPVIGGSSHNVGSGGRISTPAGPYSKLINWRPCRRRYCGERVETVNPKCSSCSPRQTRGTWLRGLSFFLVLRLLKVVSLLY